MKGKWRKNGVEKWAGAWYYKCIASLSGQRSVRYEQEKQKDLKITALYCRLSLEDGKDNESMSISNQKLMLKEYAEKNGLFNYEYYVEM